MSGYSAPDFSTSSNDAVREFFCQMQALESFAQANMAAAAAEISARDGVVEDGARNLAQWLQLVGRNSAGHAHAMARVATALVELPAIAAAYAAGELSFDQVAELTRFATSKTDAEWAERAPLMSVAQLRREARRHDRNKDDDGTSDGEAGGDGDPPLAKPCLTFSHRRDGNERLTADLDPASMAAVRAVLERQAEAYGKDPTTGLWAPRSERLADALVDHLTAAKPSKRADRATAVVHVDWATLAGLDNDSAYLDMPFAAGLAAEKARAMACDGRLDVWVDNPHGATIGIGRISCTWPPWLARKILHRDKGCRWPGCNSAIGLHIPPKGARPFLPETAAPAPSRRPPARNGLNLLPVPPDTTQTRLVNKRRPRHHPHRHPPRRHRPRHQQTTPAPRPPPARRRLNPPAFGPGAMDRHVPSSHD